MFYAFFFLISYYVSHSDKTKTGFALERFCQSFLFYVRKTFARKGYDLIKDIQKQQTNASATKLADY